MTLRSTPSRSVGVLQALRRLLARTWSGRIAFAAVATKLLVGILRSAVGAHWALAFFDGLATLALVGVLGAVLLTLLRTLRRRFLWRVRRKLILSYIFIGFVPVLLIVVFFVLAGVLVVLTVSAYLVRAEVGRLIEDAVRAARTAAAEIRPETGPSGAAAVLERARASLADRVPSASLVLVPAGRAGAPARRALTAGPWRHLEPPTGLPAWIDRSGFGGLVPYRVTETGRVDLVVRAVGLPEDPAAGYAVIVDLPIDEAVRRRVQAATGVKLGGAGLTDDQLELRVGVTKTTEQTVIVGPREVAAAAGGSGMSWVSFLDSTDWVTGRATTVGLLIEARPGDTYARISGGPARVGLPGRIVLAILGVIGALFLVIEVVALATGFALARSITGSVHALFIGTARLRQGDLTHRIEVRTDDQLGELAASFNEMTRSIEELLEHAAEKKRLEEELRIARTIQESLLPLEPVQLPGVSIAARCVPAREVGGDYYDFFPLEPRTLGLLIADVSGKGTAAALYMAELKGLVLSLSQIYRSPKRLLVEVNRILADTLDGRSFITMTYGVLDLDRHRLTYARAGHTPLIYVPANSGAAAARVLAPAGLVLGLRIDGIQARFEAILEEAVLDLNPGDLVLLFTDGLSEAMNEAAELFGEGRLARLVEQHRHLPAAVLREQIVREVEAFVGGAPLHDDMTMVLLKMDDDRGPEGISTVGLPRASAARQPS